MWIVATMGHSGPLLTERYPTKKKAESIALRRLHEGHAVKLWKEDK